MFIWTSQENPEGKVTVTGGSTYPPIHPGYLQRASYTAAQLSSQKDLRFPSHKQGLQGLE